MDEFQEADIMWPDTAPTSSLRGEVLLVPTEVLYELAAAGSASSGGASLFGRSDDQRFPSGEAASKAGASSGVDEEEWQEADVMWPDMVQAAADEPRRPRGGGGFGWLRGSFIARAGRRAKRPKPTGRREGWQPAVSSPIDIPAKFAARCR